MKLISSVRDHHSIITRTSSGVQLVELTDIGILTKESGETMRAAGLHPITTILDTQAVLITSKSPHSTTTSNPTLVGLIDMISKRIEGVIASTKFVLCTYNVRRNGMKEAMEITPGKRAATISPLESRPGVFAEVRRVKT